MFAELDLSCRNPKGSPGESPCKLLACFLTDVQYTTEQEAPAGDSDPTALPKPTTWGCTARGRPNWSTATVPQQEAMAIVQKCSSEEMATREAALKLLIQHEERLKFLFKSGEP